MADQQGTTVDTCVATLLSDTPADADSLGSHARLADSLVAVITANEGGKAVAITGPVGSGKSTVVKLAARQLEQDVDRNAVFTYDSWAHQADPLRRSFLDALIDDLAARKWLPAESVAREKERLSLRVERSTTTSESALTWPGRLLALATLLVPLGYVLLSNSIAATSKLWPSLGPLPMPVLGVLVVFAPLIVAIGTYCAWRPKVAPWHRNFWTTHRGGYAKRSVLGLFVERSGEVKRAKTLRSPDPTTVEFRAVFDSVVRDALGKDRRLVLVVDNLDRLPPDQAQTVWSTMRVFTETPTAALDAAYERLWLLVPIAKERISDIWPEYEEMERQEERDDQSREDEEPSVFGKTFTLTLAVAPPVLSNWQAFLTDQLRAALPMHGALGDFEDVGRLYAFHVRLLGGRATPRDMKRFVNHLAVLHQQWTSSIPLRVIAAYLLNESRVRNASDTFTRANFLQAHELAVVREERWAEQFAALHFNVPIDKALEVLMASPIELALEQGDMDELRRLAQTTGFPPVCTDVVDQQRPQWTVSGVGELTRAAAAVVRLHNDGLPLQAAHDNLLDAVRKGDDFSLTESLAKDLVTIVESQPSGIRASLLKHVLTHLAAIEIKEQAAPATASGVTPGVSPQVVREWATGYSHLASAAVTILGQDQRQGLGIGGNAAAYVATLRVLASGMDLPDAVVAMCAPTGTKSAEVMTGLTTRVTSLDFDTSDDQLLRLLTRIPAVKWSWSTLSAAAKTALLDFAQSKPVPQALLHGLLRLAGLNIAEARTALVEAAAQGSLLHQLALSDTASDDSAVALWLLAAMLFLPEGNLATHNGQSATGQTLYQQVLQDPSLRGPQLETLASGDPLPGIVSMLLDVARAHGVVQPLASWCLRLLTAQEGSPALDADLVVDRFDDLMTALSDADRATVVGKVLPTALLEIFKQRGFDPEACQLYLTVLAVHATTAEGFLQFLKHGLAGMKTPQWQSDLAVGAGVLGLATKVHDLDPTLELGVPLQAALDEVLRQALKDGALKPAASEAIALLGPPALKTLMRNLVDEMISAPDEHVEAVLDVACDLLLSTGALREQADGFVRRVAIGIAQRGDADALAWLERALEPSTGILAAAKPESVATLRDRLGELAERDDLEEQALLLFRRLGELVVTAIVPEPKTGQDDPEQ